MNQRTKDLVSNGLYRFSSMVSYKRSVFLLGHMRCGSTALTNVLCANPRMCDYEECHVVYNKKSKTSNALREEVGRSSLLDEAEAIYIELVCGFSEAC
jgi:hypothetical protein